MRGRGGTISPRAVSASVIFRSPQTGGKGKDGKRDEVSGCHRKRHDLLTLFYRKVTKSFSESCMSTYPNLLLFVSVSSKRITRGLE